MASVRTRLSTELTAPFSEKGPRVAVPCSSHPVLVISPTFCNWYRTRRSVRPLCTSVSIATDTFWISPETRWSKRVNCSDSALPK